MDRDETEATVSEVREAMGQTSPPVDVLKIAKEEGILLARGHYGEGFDGRIEYHQKQGKFLLFYPEVDRTHPHARVRFSIGHELGHYYLPEHRALLECARFHYSKAGFICENHLEREADGFAAALLLPEGVLADLCWRRKFLTLKDILELASEWQTSATCAAVRYAECAGEPCAMVVSAHEEIRYYVPSEDASYRGFRWLGIRKVPRGTATAEAATHQGSGRIFERQSHTEIWFSERRAQCKVWEEAFPLGYTGLVLTMLAFEIEDSDGS